MKVTYNGPSNVFLHLPPMGPQCAMGKDGKPSGERYTFYIGQSQPIYDKEHQEWYRKSAQTGGPWFVEELLSSIGDKTLEQKIKKPKPKDEDELSEQYNASKSSLIKAPAKQPEKPPKSSKPKR